MAKQHDPTRDRSDRRWRRKLAANPPDRPVSPEQFLASKRSFLAGGPNVSCRGYENLFEVVGLDRLKGLRVLDYACGSGEFGVFYAQMGARICGFDYAPTAIDAARTRAAANGVADRCDFAKADARALTMYPDGEFDLVVGNLALHHTAYLSGAMREIARVVRPGGRAVFHEPLALSGLFEPVRWVTRHTLYRGLGESTIRAHQIKELQTLFHKVVVHPFSLLTMPKRLFHPVLHTRLARSLFSHLYALDEALLKRYSWARRLAGHGIIEMVK